MTYEDVLYLSIFLNKDFTVFTSSLLSKYKAALHRNLVTLLMLEADGQLNDHAEQWWKTQTRLGELLLKIESRHESEK